MAAGDWWRGLAGSSRRLGWWTLPVFLTVGLAGAVFAGALAVVYYSQQVSDLEAQTRESREQLSQAVEDVQNAGDEALAAIEDEVDAVRESLNRQLPVEDITTLGVVVVRALVGEPPPAPPADDGAAEGAPIPLGAAQQEQPSQSEAPSPAPSPTPTSAPAQPRLGVGFAVATDGPTTFFATTYGLVRDRTARAGVVEAVEITTPEGTFRGVVHSWDENRDLALVRGEVGSVPIAKWRPSQDPVAVGERLTIAGLTPTRNPVFLNALVGFADVTAMVADIPTVEFLRGSPVVDQSGNVVAVYTIDYTPFGGEAGGGQAIAPVGLLCETMLRNCADLEADPSESPSDQ